MIHLLKTVNKYSLYIKYLNIIKLLLLNNLKILINFLNCFKFYYFEYLSPQFLMDVYFKFLHVLMLNFKFLSLKIQFILLIFLYYVI